jgi:PAS domain S-box-containing protein
MHQEELQSQSDLLAVLKQAARLSKLGYYVWDEANDRCLLINDEVANVHGLTVEEYLSELGTIEKLVRRFVPEDRERYLEVTQKGRETGVGYDIEFAVIDRWGAKHYVREIQQYEKAANGNVTKSIGVLLDLTKQKELQKTIEDENHKLMERESFLRSAAKLARMGFFVWDEANDVPVFISDEVASIYGLTVEEYLAQIRGGHSIASRMPEEDGKRYLDVVTAHRLSGIPYDIEFRIRDAHGQIHHVREVQEYFRDSSQHVVRGVGALQDISEFRKAEEEARIARERAEKALARLEQAQRNLVQAEKLASLGQLVAGVAHEINTPIGVALTAATHFQDKAVAIGLTFEAGRMTKSDLRAFLNLGAETARLMVMNIGRAAALIQSFKSIAVDQTSEERREFDLRNYIHEIILSLTPQFKKQSVATQIDCAEEILLDSYPGALAQILTNLVVNCLTHAFDPGNTNPSVTISAVRHNESEVVMTVSDNGKGIPEKHMVKLFDPFFTTKRGQGGSGLGLHIVYNLVTGRLGGTINVESTIGSGTIFRVFFPVKAPPQAQA